jgi:hypothetical protein
MDLNILQTGRTCDAHLPNMDRFLQTGQTLQGGAGYAELKNLAIMISVP